MPALRVMLVDDSPIFIKSLKSLLRRIPTLNVVATAANGVEALPLIKETQPHLLILDLNMPKMNGWEVLDELRKMKSSILVIVLSAHLEERLEQQALTKGATAYVFKGHVSHLLDTLQTIIDGYSDI
jgi:CheY-like chemotaxis protein